MDSLQLHFYHLLFLTVGLLICFSEAQTNGVCTKTVYKSVLSPTSSVGYESYRCGIFGWRRCRRSRTLYHTAYLRVRETEQYCCTGYTGTPPNCLPVECPSLSNPTNGRVSYSSQTYNSRAYYYCNTGYTRVGSFSVTCQANRQWSGSPPECPPVECSALSNPTNGRVSYSSRTYNSRAYYYCNTGYTRVGSSSVTCLANGQWSGSPFCETVDCGPLTAPTNGQVDTSSGTTFGSTATFTCDTGYMLSHQQVVMCGADGMWSPASPSCSETTEPPTTEHRNFRFTLHGETYMNNSAVSSSIIGEEDDALLCWTNKTNCCSVSSGGEFYYPNGKKVKVRAAGDPLYRNRRTQVIRLNRRPTTKTRLPLGRYRCEIPDSNDVMQSLYVTLE